MVQRVLLLLPASMQMEELLIYFFSYIERNVKYVFVLFF